MQEETFNNNSGIITPDVSYWNEVAGEEVEISIDPAKFHIFDCVMENKENILNLRESANPVANITDIVVPNLYAVKKIDHKKLYDEVWPNDVFPDGVSSEDVTAFYQDVDFIIRKMDKNPSKKKKMATTASKPVPKRKKENHEISINVIKQAVDGSNMYKPRFVRGQGETREGLCEYCNPGTWHRLKQSSYWYHMNFQHGISSVTGTLYENPVDTRKTSYWTKKSKKQQGNQGSLQINYVQGFCDSCNKWVDITQENNTDADGNLRLTNWYRHAHKCHRVKD